MTELDIFLTIFLVDYLKDISTPEKNKLLKHTIDLGEFIQWMGVGSIWVSGS